MMTKSKGTLALIAINGVVFTWLAIQQQSVFMDTQADVLAILHAGANLNPFTVGGESWRLVTSMFIHFGIIHFAVNMFVLFFLGRILESAVGTLRFLFIYFICGLAAGFASLFFNVYLISAGASGAIFGLFGYYLVAELTESFQNKGNIVSVIISFVIFVLINVVTTLLVNVDLAGHIGGCVMGVLLAFMHFKLRWLIDIKFLAMVFVVFPILMLVIPKDQLRYYEIFQRVLKAEESVGKWFKEVKSDEALKDSLLTILPEWDSIHTSISTLPGVPFELSSDTAILKQYVQLRENEASFRIKLVQRESYIYLDSLEINQGKFDSIPPLKYVLNYNLPDPEKEREPVPPPKPSYKMTKVFYDSVWKEVENPGVAAFFRLGTRDSSGRWQGQVRDYYRSGKLQMKGGYKDDLRDGVFLYYSERGTYESAGRYEKEHGVGKWERFHWNGNLKEETFLGSGGFTRNTWDSLGRPQVINGFGKSTAWYDNGKVSGEGNYEGGKREGYWRGFHRDGTPYYEDLYRDNRLIRGVSITKDGKRYVYDELSEFPMPEIGMPEFRRYLVRSMRKENIGKGGVVKVIFNVGIDGSIWDFVILESNCPECNAEAIRVVKEGPPWRSGVLHGHVRIQGQGYVEVAF